MFEQLSLSHFSPHVGSPFTIQFANGALIALTLTEAADLGSTERQEQFALSFQGPVDPILPQSTYSLSHEGLGQVALFLVAVEKKASGILYQAVFNRFRQAHP